MFNANEMETLTKMIVSVIHEAAEYSACTVGTKATIKFSDFTSGYGDLTVTLESSANENEEES